MSKIIIFFIICRCFYLPGTDRFPDRHCGTGNDKTDWKPDGVIRVTAHTISVDSSIRRINMYSYIKGILRDMDEESIVVETGGSVTISTQPDRRSGICLLSGKR